MIQNIQIPNKRFLLLSCCAPCSCAVIKVLAENKANFSVIFYNPNNEFAKACASKSIKSSIPSPTPIK